MAMDDYGSFWMVVMEVMEIDQVGWVGFDGYGSGSKSWYSWMVPMTAGEWMLIPLSPDMVLTCPDPSPDHVSFRGL